MATRRRAARRKPLSRERVLQAALKFVDGGGLEALSMRKLAQELGVEAMSLYNHVKNKDDILDGIIELVAEEIDPPRDGADWKSALRESALSMHEALARHPWAARIWMSTRTVSPRRLHYADATLRTLRAAGFSEDLTYHGYHTITGHVQGFTLQEVNFPFDRESLKEMAAKFLRDFPSEEYPDLAEHIRQHVEPPNDHEGSFELGLDLILDGLERLRDTK